MDYLFLTLTVFAYATTSICGKGYNLKNIGGKDPVPAYNFLLLATVFIGWYVLYAFDFSFDVSVLPYSLSFALLYIFSFLGTIYALKSGSAALTSLLIGFSLILTTVWGLIFWNAELNAVIVSGLVLAVISVFLCVFRPEESKKKASLKWFLCVVVAMVGNAGCQIIQRTQQTTFNGRHGKMLMTIAAFISFAVFFVIYLVKRKSGSEPVTKKTAYLPVLSGVCNVLLNFFVILLATSELSPSLVYPAICVGGIIVVTLFSLAVFKEKLRRIQWVGIVIGIAATLLLSL